MIWTALINVKTGWKVLFSLMVCLCDLYRKSKREKMLMMKN